MDIHGFVDLLAPSVRPLGALNVDYILKYDLLKLSGLFLRGSDTFSCYLWHLELCVRNCTKLEESTRDISSINT